MTQNGLWLKPGESPTRWQPRQERELPWPIGTASAPWGSLALRPVLSLYPLALSFRFVDSRLFGWFHEIVCHGRPSGRRKATTPQPTARDYTRRGEARGLSCCSGLLLWLDAISPWKSGLNHTQNVEPTGVMKITDTEAESLSNLNRSVTVQTMNEVFSALSVRRRYEVWFVRLGLADGSGAWWFRYLLMNPGRGGCPGNPARNAGSSMGHVVSAGWGTPQSFIQGFSVEDLELSARGQTPFHFRHRDQRHRREIPAAGRYKSTDTPSPGICIIVPRFA